MAKIISDIVSLIYPSTCPGCGRSLLREEQELCLHCQVNLPVRLAVWNTALEQRFYGRLQLEEVYAYLLFTRKGLTQKLLHSIKYRGNKELAKKLGAMFGCACKKRGLYKTVELVAPIPLHKSKERLRGFNQSALIAESLANELGCHFTEDLLERKRKTSTQTRKNRMERWQNVADIFEVKKNSIANQHILLVDDVVTTGATLESCGQSLVDAGVKKLSVACLALA